MSDDVFVMIFLVLVVVFVAVFSGHFFYLDLAKRKSSMDTAKKEMMDKFEHDGFNADRILLYSNTKKECAFLIDFTNNRIRFCDLCYDDRLEVQRTEGDFLLSSIRGCEFLQTDAKTGGIKRIVVGTFLGGGVGAIIGAFTKGRIIKDIKLVFYFDDVIEPSKNIYLLSRTKNGSNEYDEVQHFADEVITLMKVIIARNTTKR